MPNVTADPEVPTAVQTRAMRDVILAQCFGCLGYVVFVQGVMLLYMSAHGLSSVLFGSTMSSYDAILLGYATLTLLFVVTLGLVPSVIGKPQWLPRGN